MPEQYSDSEELYEDVDPEDALAWCIDKLEHHFKMTLKPDDPEWNDLRRAQKALEVMRYA